LPDVLDYGWKITSRKIEQDLIDGDIPKIDNVLDRYKTRDEPQAVIVMQIPNERS
jgi:hypothetical protein